MGSRASAAARVARATGVTLVIVLGLILAPAASASFTASGTAIANSSTATLAVPSDFPVTAVCPKIQGEYHLSISVAETHPTVQFANYLELRVYGPATQTTAGALKHTGSLSTSAGRAYAPSAMPSNVGKSTVWTYEIWAEYRVEGTSNFWRSAAPRRGTVTCA